MGFDMRKIVRSFISDTGLNDALVHRLICLSTSMYLNWIYCYCARIVLYIYVLSIELLKCVCTKYYTFENVYMLFNFSQMHKL